MISLIIIVPIGIPTFVDKQCHQIARIYIFLSNVKATHNSMQVQHIYELLSYLGA